MTCIVGLVNGNTVWIGGDSAGTDSNLQRIIIRDPKVFIKDDFAFGMCGTPKAIDALRYGVTLPSRPIGSDERGFLVNDVVPTIRAGLQKLDCAGPTQTGEIGFQGGALIGYMGRLYTMQGNFQLIQSAEDFAAIGSGAQLALGSMHGSGGEHDPRKRITAALEAAAKSHAGVAPPFVIVNAKKRFV